MVEKSVWVISPLFLQEPLGRVVINLADFASEDGRATQAFTVACSRSISAAVGEAKLLVTIGCASFCTPSLSYNEGYQGWTGRMYSTWRSCIMSDGLLGYLHLGKTKLLVTET